MAYEEPWVRQQLADAGFRLAHPIRYGLWPGRAAFLSYQDILVVERSVPLTQGLPIDKR
jgi:hypothetical protein